MHPIVVAPRLNRVCRVQKESPVAWKLEIKRNNLIYSHFKVTSNRFDTLHPKIARDINTDLLCFGAILIYLPDELFRFYKTV